MYIFCGLGNPGRKYRETRHNMGFQALDFLAENLGVRIKKEKFQALIGEGTLGGERLLLVKPATYMNLSGCAVREAVQFYKIPHEHLVVLYDDLDLPAGTLRVRKAGGPGTHRGMQSVVRELGFSDFPRIRIGIGAHGESDVIDYVIGRVGREERAFLREAAEKAAKAAETLVLKGIDAAMNEWNG